MRVLYALLTIACLAGVLVPYASDYRSSLEDLRGQAERYAFDGERYVLDADAPEPAASALQAPVVDSAEQLGAASPPFLVHVRGEPRPLLVLDLDRTFVKAYEPGVGLVLYLRRVLDPRVVAGPAVPSP